MAFWPSLFTHNLNGGLISESFSHWLNLQKMCQITILSIFSLVLRIWHIFLEIEPKRKKSEIKPSLAKLSL
jgi:hypothetical protein